jgi:hypothetical protein
MVKKEHRIIAKMMNDEINKLSNEPLEKMALIMLTTELMEQGRLVPKELYVEVLRIVANGIELSIGLE